MLSLANMYTLYFRLYIRLCICLNKLSINNNNNKNNNKNNNNTDEIPSYILQKFSYDLSLPLSIIFNKSIENGSCPIKWKYSFIIPIFKKGDPSKRENYRPISITSIISRVFERLITKQINYFY